MTTLNQLKTMKNEDIQNWLRKVGIGNVGTLVTALLGADDETKNCVYRNMSSHAVNELKKDLNRTQKMGVSETTIIRSASELEKLI